MRIFCQLYKITQKLQIGFANRKRDDIWCERIMRAFNRIIYGKLHAFNTTCHLPVIMMLWTISKWRRQNEKKERIKRMYSRLGNQHFIELRAVRCCALNIWFANWNTNTSTNTGATILGKSLCDLSATAWHGGKCHFCVVIVIIYIFKFIWRQQIAAHKLVVFCLNQLNIRAKERERGEKTRVRHNLNTGAYSEAFFILRSFFQSIYSFV